MANPPVSLDPTIHNSAPVGGGRGPGAGLQFWERAVGWMTAFNNRWKIAEERWLLKDGRKEGREQ